MDIIEPRKFEKMGLMEAASRIDKSKENEEGVDLDELCQEFDLDFSPGWHQEVEKRLKSYWLFNWQCTDTWVGGALIFLDGEFVGTSMQQFRKSSVEFEWVDTEKAEKVRAFVKSIVESEQTYSPGMCDLEERFTPTFNIAYSGQLLRRHYSGFWKGEPVTVTQIFSAFDQIDRWDSVVVKTAAGVDMIIPMSEYDIPMNLVLCEEK